MNKQLKGIALLLFGILLCISDRILNYTLLSSLPNFPFAPAGVIAGIIGLVFVFRRQE